MNQLEIETAIDFLAQIVHVNVDHVRKGIVIDPPYVLRDHRAAENLVAAAKQKLQERKFLRRQVDPLIAPAHLAGYRVEPQICNRQDGGRSGSSAPQQSAHSRQQFLERKRLGQIIIRAEIQTRNFVSDRYPSRQQKHRDVDSPSTNFFYKTQSIKPRQHDIENDEVVAVSQKPIESGLAIVLHIHRIVSRLKPTLDKARD